MPRYSAPGRVEVLDVRDAQATAEPLSSITSFDVEEDKEDAMTSLYEALPYTVRRYHLESSAQYMRHKYTPPALRTCRLRLRHAPSARVSTQERPRPSIQATPATPSTSSTKKCMTARQHLTRRQPQENGDSLTA